MDAAAIGCRCGPPDLRVDRRPYGSNRRERCPKSSAISIGLRSRTLATIAEGISHSHPALTVAAATRIEHHCGTCGDRDATDFFHFTCSHVSADTAPIFPVQEAALFLPLIFSGTASG